MGSRRFELLTSAMSRRRHNQLDHEPSRINGMPLNIGYIPIKLFSFPSNIACQPPLRPRFTVGMNQYHEGCFKREEQQ